MQHLHKLKQISPLKQLTYSSRTLHSSYKAHTQPMRFHTVHSLLTPIAHRAHAQLTQRSHSSHKHTSRTSDNKTLHLCLVIVPFRARSTQPSRSEPNEIFLRIFFFTVLLIYYWRLITIKTCSLK